MKDNIYSFIVEPEALKRYYSLYVVVATSSNRKKIKIYSGKTGDNREGCNPVISRCGNHFSYNKIHSQVRNKIFNHENFFFKYFFTHFDKYSNYIDRHKIDKINELERILLKKIETEFSSYNFIELLNTFKGKYQKKFNNFHTKKSLKKIDKLINTVKEYINEPYT